MRAGDLIYHYARNPLYLEQTFDQAIFTYYDDSKDKLSMETLFLIFVTWLFVMVGGAGGGALPSAGAPRRCSIRASRD